MAIVNGERRPNWTVIVETCPGANWVGKTYMFFDQEDMARDVYSNPRQYVMHVRQSVVVRPYYEASDRQHLPAVI